MSAKIGRDTPLSGDLRLRSRDNHQVIYFETDDAGALFRFTDMYPRMFGGQMWVAMDPPTQEQRAAGRHALYPQFRRARRTRPRTRGRRRARPAAERRAIQRGACEFTRVPGRMAVRDGVVRGPVVGATIEGQIDYVKDDMHLRGTFVPFYGLNNMFGQMPIVGLILGGGSNEGLLGITYEAIRPAECAAHHGQSGDRDRARAAAQVHPVARQFRPQFYSAVAVVGRRFPFVPAKAGTQSYQIHWIPAFAGMSGEKITRLSAARASSCRARA